MTTRLPTPTTSLVPVPSTAVVDPEAGPVEVTVVLSDGTEIGRIVDGDSVGIPTAYASVVSRAWHHVASGSGVVPTSPAWADPALSGSVLTLALDPNVEAVVDDVLARWSGSPEAGIAAVVVDNETGLVLAARSTGSGFDVGRRFPVASLAQVFTTIAALEAGFDVDSLWDASSPQEFVVDEGVWTVIDPGGDAEDRVVTLGDGLVLAHNTVAAGVAVEIGPEPIHDVARRLGVDPFTDGSTVPPSIAVGAGEIDLFQAATMFATIARGGIRTDATVIALLVDENGAVLYETPEPSEAVVDPAVIAAVRAPLAAVTERGTGTRARLAEPQIGKTATGQDFAVTWYVGSTDRYTAAVVVARSDGRPLVDLTFGGQAFARVYGGTLPAPIWADIMMAMGEHVDPP
ncbi:MAG: penicillin-binding transpeptidase domain-containing protein [Acidimicrobiia bacterium]|nr:penicillin-binding transpeptidase domain-containing protein [Acidimicrobiia bacterium]